jgi:tRNA(Arg) A34 adenosine deaminase TadA
MNPEKQFMGIAINEAKEIAKQGGYPIGSVIVKNGEIVATGRSIAKVNNDPTSHAEIDAIRNATRKVGSMYLEDCVLYTTLEPCAMCAAAAVWVKLKGIVYGASMEDAINFADSVKDKNISLSFRQIKIKCREVLEKAETKLELVENFEREKCIKLFELSK